MSTEIQIAALRFTHVHTLTLVQWVWDPVRYILAALQVVCLHEAIMLSNGWKVAGVNH